MVTDRNESCPCTYPGCPRHGNCRECIAYHRRLGEFTGCMFSPEAEKTWDRSFEKLVEDRK
ncbi:MAG: hypothetical protein KAR44_05635 [Candidatus Aegiribacteria sp.]|nr:hypothetical protein [Candidatus Aegiribacteria sp.]